MENKAIVYYSDGELDAGILAACQRTIAAAGLPIYSVTLVPMDFGHNQMMNRKRGYLTMARQQLAGLEALPVDVDTVFFCEHDVLYHPSHFEVRLLDRGRYWYNVNVWKVRISDGHAISYIARQASGLCADREVLLKYYRARVKALKSGISAFRLGFEPGCCTRAERLDKIKPMNWESTWPNVDLKHDRNATRHQWSLADFKTGNVPPKRWQEGRYIPGWGSTDAIMATLRP